MTNIQKIESEIKKLPLDEFARLRDWFEKYDAENWDKQLELDVSSNKLDNLAENAIQDFKEQTT